MIDENFVPTCCPVPDGLRQSDPRERAIRWLRFQPLSDGEEATVAAHGRQVTAKQLAELTRLEPRPFVVVVAYIHTQAVDEAVLAVGRDVV